MKKLIMLLLLISIFTLAGCNSNENIDNENLTGDVENQLQNSTSINNENVENQFQNEANTNNENLQSEVITFSDRTKDAREQIKNMLSNKEYGIKYTSIKQSGEKYILKVAFGKIISIVEADQYYDGYIEFDENDNKIIEVELNADDKIMVIDTWSSWDGYDHVEMPAGEIDVSELYELEHNFSYDTRNGLYFDDIDEENIYVLINMAGLT